VFGTSVKIGCPNDDGLEETDARVDKRRNGRERGGREGRTSSFFFISAFPDGSSMWMVSFSRCTSDTKMGVSSPSSSSMPLVKAEAVFITRPSSEACREGGREGGWSEFGLSLWLQHGLSRPSGGAEGAEWEEAK